MNSNQPLNAAVIMTHLKNGIWLLGIPSGVFGITNRTMVSFADGYLSALDLAQLFIASFLFITWLSCKPEESFNSVNSSQQSKGNSDHSQGFLCPGKARMYELQAYHTVSQEYILPFSSMCQIYHLLNLSHLETIHAFSLNNLKVIQVTHFQPTAVGGIIKFQTTLDSPLNILRIWRLPIVEVILTLHAPYTVELCIPAYNDKKIIVIFNVVPISNKEHQLLIDIYTDLKWPKPLLQILLHMASCLTLFEDLPYLYKLSQRNLSCLLNLNRVSNHETMRLFKRFVELYGSTMESLQPTDS
ncbi:MAG TPA: hypothetical protein DCL61_08240 [Cyanobacteria bacterium UBA12227]|nr:hypothetical protein [Cyanobacteria bacterium UBA12227]HAX89417.1 hypothetical protein [Cyanobacteria bacterium UBA11370]HBY76493.1 hypothetical protein [Cyanobacteria bacterium UBA11148]